MSLSENRFPPRIKSGAGFSGTCAKWSGWLDSNQRPPASEAGTLAGLSYTLLALRREIESLSPDRQSGRLTRCVTERELVRLGRLERPLNALSTHSLCQLGYRRVIIRYRRGHGREQGLEDQAGFEPAVGASPRIKSPRRSAATVTGPMILEIGGPGWFRATCRRVKSPLPLHSGLRLRVQT